MTKREFIKGELYLDGEKVLKIWESFSGWYWYATNLVEADWNGAPLWNGYVQGLECEWGDFSEAELIEMKPRVWEVPKKNWAWTGRVEA